MVEFGWSILREIAISFSFDAEFFLLALLSIRQNFLYMILDKR